MKTLRWLLNITSAGQVAVALWLLSVLFTIIPTSERLFWTIVMVGFITFAVLTWLYLQNKGGAAIKNILLSGTILAIIAGVFALFNEYIHLQDSQHFEGYIVLMGLALLSHSTFLLFYMKSNKPVLQKRIS